MLKKREFPKDIPIGVICKKITQNPPNIKYVNGWIRKECVNIMFRYDICLKHLTGKYKIKISFFYSVLGDCRKLFLLKIPITKVIPMKRVMSENYYG